MFSVKKRTIDSFLHGLEGVLIHNEPMGKHSRWNVGGKAQCYYSAVGKTGVVQLMCQLPGNIPILWLGSGNNTLVRDGGIKGVTLSAREGLSAIYALGEKRIYVESGVNNFTLARYLKDQSVTGYEFLSTLRGTLGGALAMGASEPDKWGSIARLECVNRDGDLAWCELEQLSKLLQEPDPKKQIWIVGAEFKFQNPQTKRHKALSLLKNMPERFASKKAPTGIYQASDQINPTTLLQKSGLAGLAIGGAAFGTHSPNNLSLNKRTCVADVEDLVRYGQRIVKQKFDVQLHSLINFVGERA